jgi:hypothetical protein
MWLHEKRWTELHFQFGKFTLFEVLKYLNWIVIHAETSKNVAIC